MPPATGDAAAVQESSEPGQEAQRPGAARLQAEAGAQPPPDPPFGQVFQFLLGDAGEIQDDPALEAEAVHLPGVAGILGVPAAGLRQVGDLPAGPGQQRDLVAALPPERVPPFLLGSLQQRGRPAAGQEPDHDHHHVGRGLALPVIVAALQRVLHLQFHLGGQAVQMDPFAAGAGLVVFPLRGEHLRGRAGRAASRSRYASGTSHFRARPTDCSCRSGTPPGGPRAPCPEPSPAIRPGPASLPSPTQSRAVCTGPCGARRHSRIRVPGSTTAGRSSATGRRSTA